MSLFIIQLLIISAVGLMVQSAPVSVTNVHLQKRDAAANPIEEDIQRKLENRLYCAADTLHNAVGHLQRSDEKVTLDPTEIDVNITEISVDNKTFDFFSKDSNLCESFIIAMSIKHQLQDLLFNTNIISELSFKNTKRLYTIITNLQTMANTFDDMQLHQHHSRCVEFTPVQYRIMYYVRYTDTPLLNSLEELGRNWTSENSNYKYPRH